MGNTIISTTPQITGEDSVPNSGQDDVVEAEVVVDWQAEVEALIAEVGSPKAIIDRLDSVADVENQNLARWFTVSHGVRESGAMTAREFGDATGTDKNWLGRLDIAGLLYAAHVDKGLDLTPREAVKVANVRSRGDIDKMIASVKRGSDPLGTKAGRVKPSQGQGSRTGNGGQGSTGTKATEPKPEHYAPILEWIAANLDKASADSKRRMLTSAEAIVQALHDEGVEPIDLDLPVDLGEMTAERVDDAAEIGA